jgi:hypothetical protein
MSSTRFTIITPTLQRESLVRCCDSVDGQNFASWQHIVMVDDANKNRDLCMRIKRNDEMERRWVHKCGRRHGHFGNRCRHDAWLGAMGEYLVMLDDDNLMFHEGALADIDRCLTSAGEPDFALFPVHRHGSVFLMEPPGLCRTDTANVVCKREIGRWPDIEAREADGHWVEALKEKYSYVSFPDVAPIILMEYSSNGV